MTEPDKQDLEKDDGAVETVHELVYDRGYCWVVCGGCFILNGCTWGMNSGFAIFFSVYLNNDTFAGATKLDYAAIGGLALGLSLIFTPFLNYLMGVIGIRSMIIIGNLIDLAALLLASFSRKLWQLYLTQGVLQSLGLAMISLPSLTILPQFFKKRRVLASGLATAGSGAGGIIFNVGMQAVVEARDVWWALRAQAIISFGLICIATVMIRSRAEHHKIEFTLFDMQVVKSVGFAIASLIVVTFIFGYGICLYTLANFTTSLGYSEYQGSIASAMIHVGSIIGRPIVGLLADKLGPCTVAFLTYGIAAIFVFGMWIPARNFATVLAYGIIIGSVMGSVYPTISPLLARLVGIRKMNITLSLLWSLSGIAAVVSPVIGVELIRGKGGTVDPTSYLDCSIFVGVSFAVCSASAFVLRAYILARDDIIANTLPDSNDVEIKHQNESETLLTTPVPFTHIVKFLFAFKGTNV